MRSKLMQVLTKINTRSFVYQTTTLALVLLSLYYFASNTSENLQKQGIASGFDFLSDSAGFDIIMHLVEYTEDSSYLRAFFVGLTNTLLVSIIGIILSTLVGFTVGIARLSDNFLMRGSALVYIEILRNVPLLLQIFIWYFGVLRSLPDVRESFSLNQIFFLSNRGLYIPKPLFESTWPIVVFSFLLGMCVYSVIQFKAQRLKEKTGQEKSTLAHFFLLCLLLPIFVFLISGKPISWSLPVFSRFDYEGGLVLIPEFVALLMALSFYTASFIAEIVRAGILSVGKGQVEASYSLGLSKGQTLKLIIIPQALRVIIPPLTSQYLNLTKNSSLAAAIAYPDLVLIFAGTVLMQTGQAIEVIMVTMLVYLTISLFISLFMNWYNQKMAIVER